MKPVIIRFQNCWIILVCITVLAACTNYEQDKQSWPDTYDKGTIHISADESFKPIIDAQVQVYEANRPGTKIIVHYKPEAECLKDFAVDSIRMIIATRGYSEAEENFMIDSLKVGPRKLTIAHDAIAVIVNPQSSDSLFTMDELKQILQGNFNKKLIPVFDGVQATSTVRFIVDSVLKAQPLSPQAVAARTSEGVIDYIAKTPDAIGFIGVSWIGNKEDTAHMNFLKKVKIAHIESTDKPGGFVLPYQANIYMNRYPMVRDLVYTLKERHKGLGTGFADFLADRTKGQLIFRRAYLVPALASFTVRQAKLRE
jgi:phosphate transport system substrate-binding protein